MPTERIPLQRPRRGHLSPNALQELQYGPSPYLGSCFTSREELRDTWQRARERLMASANNPGRRPVGFYEFEFDGPRPRYDVERSVLWRSNLLTADERATLEREWKVEFDKAQAPDFTLNDGHELLSGEAARIAHLAWCDCPRELVRRWTAARKRRAQQEAPPEEAAAVK